MTTQEPEPAKTLTLPDAPRVPTLEELEVYIDKLKIELARNKAFRKHLAAFHGVTETKGADA